MVCGQENEENEKKKKKVERDSQSLKNKKAAKPNAD